jgi:hypothetical protein
MPVHTIQQGEHLSTLAERYGFQTYERIWNDPANADLKQLRKNPNVLMPGDEVTIPDLEDKSMEVPTTKLHRFVLRGSGLKLRLVILDHSGKPRASEACKLAIEGDASDMETDGDGKVERKLAPSVRRASVALDDVEVPIDVGYLDPVDHTSGWQGRLVNLGYLESPVDDPDDPDVRSAVEEFQCDYGLKVTGDSDAATQAKLLEIHGV